VQTRAQPLRAKKEKERERASSKEWEEKVADCEGEKEKETRQRKSEEGNRESTKREKLRTQSGGKTGQKSRGNREKGTLREQRGLQRE
jgi:hypothetical protein